MYGSLQINLCSNHNSGFVFSTSNNDFTIIITNIIDYL